MPARTTRRGTRRTGRASRSPTTRSREIGAKRIVQRLEEIGGGRPVVCLCWERPGDEWCHRWQLAAFIERETGIEVPELQAGMLAKRPDHPQPSLFDGEEIR